MVTASLKPYHPHQPSDRIDGHRVAGWQELEQEVVTARGHFSIYIGQACGGYERDLGRAIKRAIRRIRRGDSDCSGCNRSYIVFWRNHRYPVTLWHSWCRVPKPEPPQRLTYDSGAHCWRR